MNRFEGKTAIVTGAAHGIGEAIARRFADEGARVALLDLDFEGAKAAAEKIGRGAIALPCDVSKRDQVENTIDRKSVV